VINTNLHPILHRFRVIADYWSNFRFRQRVHTRSRWTAKLKATKFDLNKRETSIYRMALIDQQMIISFSHNACVWRTDRRTDRYR